MTALFLAQARRWCRREVRIYLAVPNSPGSFRGQTHGSDTEPIVEEVRDLAARPTKRNEGLVAPLLTKSILVEVPPRSLETCCSKFLTCWPTVAA